MGLPARVIALCKASNVLTLGELLDFLETTEAASLLKRPNFGRTSLSVLESLEKAVRAGSVERLREWIPLSRDARRLSVWEALRHAVLRFDPPHRRVLASRLSEGRTLKASAQEIGCSRARVQQIEIMLLTEVRETLDWFSDEIDSVIEVVLPDEDAEQTLPEELADVAKDDTMIIVGALGLILL